MTLWRGFFFIFDPHWSQTSIFYNINMEGDTTISSLDKRYFEQYRSRNFLEMLLWCGLYFTLCFNAIILVLHRLLILVDIKIYFFLIFFLSVSRIFWIFLFPIFEQSIVHQDYYIKFVKNDLRYMQNWKRQKTFSSYSLSDYHGLLF